MIVNPSLHNFLLGGTWCGIYKPCFVGMWILDISKIFMSTVECTVSTMDSWCQSILGPSYCFQYHCKLVIYHCWEMINIINGTNGGTKSAEGSVLFNSLPPSLTWEDIIYCYLSFFSPFVYLSLSIYLSDYLFFAN